MEKSIGSLSFVTNGSCLSAVVLSDVSAIKVLRILRERCQQDFALSDCHRSLSVWKPMNNFFLGDKVVDDLRFDFQGIADISFSTCGCQVFMQSPQDSAVIIRRKEISKIISSMRGEKATLILARVKLCGDLKSVESSPEIFENSSAQTHRNDIGAKIKDLGVKINLIENALRRAVFGEYGLCVNCGEEIDLRRLRITPTTPFCIDCAEKAQRDKN
jgi:DnaK suppressor protein